MSALGNEDTIALNVLLNCEVTKSSEIKQTHFKSLPTTPLEIKKKIEEDFSIPSCVQTLHYQSMVLKDSDQLQRTHFRSGDTFTVDYPIEAECELTQSVIKWLNELYEVLRSIKECISSPDEEHDLLISSNFHKIETLIMRGEMDDIINTVSLTLFFPWGDKKKLMNKFYFHQEGGLDVLMETYGILVSKEWGDLGIDKRYHCYLEHVCSQALCNYIQTLAICRQVIQLGGLEMCTATLLRRQLQGDVGVLETHIYDTIRSALFTLSNLSHLPECQVPLARRTDVTNQILAIALNPAYDCMTAKVSVDVMLNLTQSPQAHTYIVRKEVMENILKICEQKQKMVSEQSSQSQETKEEDLVILRCMIGIVLAQVGLGSPPLLFDSIPPHLLHQIFSLMSDMLEAATPAEACQYDISWWETFLPYLRYLYTPSTIKSVTAESSVSSGEDTRRKLHISCCNVILYGLETVFGRYVNHHLEVLLKEGLLDYTMCLPAVLPGECQPRARSLVNELGKHRQLQPPSLCTLAKAHIAKKFCGLQPVMEMNSIAEFIYKYFPAS